MDNKQDKIFKGISLGAIAYAQEILEPLKRSQQKSMLSLAT